MTPGYAFPQRKLWQPIIKGEKKKPINGTDLRKIG